MALVTPNNKSLLKLAKSLGKPESYTREQLCNDRDIYDKIYESLVESGKKSHLHKKEIPLRIKLCAEEWTSDNDLITAALKLKRTNVLSYYKNEVKKLFQLN